MAVGEVATLASALCDRHTCGCGVRVVRLPIEVLSGGDGQRAAVPAWTEQHVPTVWVSLQ